MRSARSDTDKIGLYFGFIPEVFSNRSLIDSKIGEPFCPHEGIVPAKSASLILPGRKFEFERYEAT
jgi:hypothetical protein